MPRATIHELRRSGVSQEDIELAKATQAAQRRNGAPVQSIAVLVGAAQPRQRPNPNPLTDLTDRALRRRGAYDQAALLADQQALQESSLWSICRHLSWQSYECSKTAADLCEITRTDKAQMARALDLLEQVGAIRRVKRGRTKIITVTPEGAFRGNVNHHGQAVERYRLDVIEGGKTDSEK